uniref:Uncharacterized protein n=1 Tax=Mycena chlorophos TaxID=658473 RepID=A0ABQ0M1R6_MYCCL|nr:predicted protein [Mycena chlorophos]
MRTASQLAIVANRLSSTLEILSSIPRKLTRGARNSPNSSTSKSRLHLPANHSHRRASHCDIIPLIAFLSSIH